MTITDILAAIESGALDKDLSKISSAITQRQKSRSNTAFKVGDKVIFNNLTATRYMVGRTATVVGINRTKLRVLPDEAVGRFGKFVNGVAVPVEIVVPAGIIDHA